MEKKFEKKPGTGALFVNEKKEKESQPNVTGYIVTPEGIEYEVSGWKKEMKTGKHFVSLSCKSKKENNNQPNDLPF